MKEKILHMNKLLKLSNYCADYTVFIASWLKKLDIYHADKPCKVILNGGDRQIFRDYKKTIWNGITPLKIVTHHWVQIRWRDLMFIKIRWFNFISWVEKEIEFTYNDNQKDLTLKIQII